MSVLETLKEQKLRKKREEYRRNYATYAAHRVRYRARRAELNIKYNELTSPEQKMLWSAKYRASKNGVEFSLTVADVHIPDACPLLGIPLTPNTRSGKPLPGSPTLDRKSCSLGYTKDNVWVISHKANRAKNNLTIDELELLTKNLRLHSD